MSGPVVASFALNSTGLGHASRLVAIHDALRRHHDIPSIFFTEHRISLIDEYGFEQVVLPPYEGSLLGDAWWNRDEGTPATSSNSPALARMIIAEVLSGCYGVALHDVVLHEQLYFLARQWGWHQAFVHRPRSDVADPLEWLANRAPGVETMYLIGARESLHRGDVTALAVPNVRREPISRDSVWDESDTGIRIAVSAGGGGHADAGVFVNTAVEAVARFAGTAGREVSAFVVPGPFYREQVVLPRGAAARFRLLSYLPPTFALHRDTDVQICQGGYNTIQELAGDGVRAVVVPGRRMIDDQALRARELAATAPNIRVAECDATAIVTRLAELTATPGAATVSPPPAGNGAEHIADSLAKLAANATP